MPLDPQKVYIEFSKGVDTKTDPKQVVAGEMLVLQNASMQSPRQFQKRDGFTQLSQSISTIGSITSGVGLTSFQNELVELDGQSLYSYAVGESNWVLKSQMISTQLQTSTVNRNTFQQTCQDSALNGSIQLFTWVDSSGGVRYSLFDVATNQSIVNNKLVLSTASKAKALSLGSSFFIVYHDGSTNLSFKTISISTPNTLSGATVISSAIDTGAFAFDATTDGVNVYTAYSTTSANKISIKSINALSSVSSAFDVTTTGSASVLNIVSDHAGSLWGSYASGNNSNNIFTFIVSSSAGKLRTGSTALDSIVVGTNSIKNIASVISSSVATYFYESAQGSASFISTALTPNYIKTTTASVVGSTLSIGSPSFYSRGLGLSSKAFVYNNSNYLVTAFQSPLQSTYYLMNGSAVAVAKISPSNGGGYTAVSSSSLLTEVNVIGSSYQFASLIKDNITSASGDIFTQTGVISAQVSFPATAPSKVVIGNNLHIAGGILNMYDGANVVEHGYNNYPEGMTTQFTSGSTGGVGPGVSTAALNQYQYCVVYEWTDNQGQVHQSAPSIPVTVVIPTSSTVNFIGTVISNSSDITSVSTTDGIFPGMYVSCVFLGSSGGQPVLNTFFRYSNQIVSISGTTITMAVASGTVGGGTITTGFLATTFPQHAVPASVNLNSNTLSNIDTLADGAVIYGSVQGSGAGVDVSRAFPSGTYVTSSSDFTVNNVSNITAAGLFYTLDNGFMSLSIPTLKNSTKKNVSIVVYRTTVNGTVFYRQSSTTNPIYNDTTVDYINIIDSATDNKIIGNQQLYTTGGEVENISAPAVNALTTFKSRALYIPSENPLQFGYSKQDIPGIPIEFNSLEFFENVDQRIGALTAIGTIDDKIILFGSNIKFYVVGSGPSPSGQNNDFSDPVKLAGSTGCQNQASIVEIPVGLIYQDKIKGFWMLDRSLQEQYIGAQVESFSGATVTSARVVPNKTQVRMTLDTGSVLVYDYIMNQWETDVYASAAIDSTIFQNNFTYLQSNGLIQEQSPGVFTDNGNFVPMSLTTGWLNFSGVQGFMRVWEMLILGIWKSPHTLTVNVYSDFNDTTPTQTQTFDATSQVFPYEFRLRIVHQKGTSIKIQITENQTAPYGEGLSLSGLTFILGVKRGLQKLPASVSG